MRMNEAGCFTEDMEEEGNQQDIISELYVEEEGRSAVRPVEQSEKDGVLLEEKQVAVEEALGAMLVREAYMTSARVQKSMKE